MATIYLTTAIDYVNAKPHIGHAYEKIIADVLARWHRLKGDNVFFLTGTDENAQKNDQAAKEAGVQTKDFVDKNSTLFEELCKVLHLSHDDFIKTTEERHVNVAKAIYQKLFDAGDIYKGMYKGLYCFGCEAYYTERDLEKGLCPEHKKPAEKIEQECYFFKMSKYEEQVLALLEQESFIVPEGKRKEMFNRVKSEGLKDICVSRKSGGWGIVLPFDEEHRGYVWIDALCNYISALGYPDGKKFAQLWNGGTIVHVIGKGINWFHSVIWPSLLLALDVKVPDHILVHGYLTVDGQKVSKSLGNSIDPVGLVEEYGVDALRYFLLREIPLQDDGDFSEQGLVTRLNTELADALGNLLSRSLAMVDKYFDGKVPQGKPEGELVEKLDIDVIEKHLEHYEFHHALEKIWNFIHAINKYINENKPWEDEKRRAIILYNVLDALRMLAILIHPFIPDTTAKINAQLGVTEGQWSDIEFGILESGRKINKGENLFNKIE
jgi:methionyl-tRNA synthetase